MKGTILALCLVVAAAGPTSAGELKPFVRGSWQTLRRNHAGKPTIVHFWGLSCAPCLAELPKWSQLLRQRRDLDLILVAADPVAESPVELSRVLAKAGLGSAESWVFADRFEERLRFEVDPAWAGELPKTVQIGRDGKESSALGTADFDAIRKWLDSEVSPPERQTRSSRATLEPVVDQGVVHPGSTVNAVLRVTLPKGTHVQSNHPRDRALIPTTLTVAAPTGISVRDVLYPTPIDLKQEGAAQPLAVFEGEFVIRVVLSVARGTPTGNAKIVVHLRYQPCDARLCYLPATTDASWTLVIQ
jgi:thiol-disulfide isomerase/thioredoxin